MKARYMKAMPVRSQKKVLASLQHPIEITPSALVSFDQQWDREDEINGASADATHSMLILLHTIDALA